MAARRSPSSRSGRVDERGAPTEIVRLREELVHARQEAERYRELWVAASAKSDRDREQLTAIRRSLRWRLTHPLRALARRRNLGDPS